MTLSEKISTASSIFGFCLLGFLLPFLLWTVPWSANSLPFPIPVLETLKAEADACAVYRELPAAELGRKRGWEAVNSAADSGPVETQG